MEKYDAVYVTIPLSFGGRAEKEPRKLDILSKVVSEIDLGRDYSIKKRKINVLFIVCKLVYFKSQKTIS